MNILLVVKTGTVVEEAFMTCLVVGIATVVSVSDFVISELVVTAEFVVETGVVGE